jgi:hypothetical protein
MKLFIDDSFSTGANDRRSLGASGAAVPARSGPVRPSTIYSYPFGW